MIDIHSHILYGLDDGPSDQEDSIRMLCEAEEAGVKVIIATPHFRGDTGIIGRTVERFNELADKAAKSNVTLLQGFEVSLSPGLSVMVQNMTKLLLADSRYLLVEIPRGGFPQHAFETFYQLQLMGIVPIIAHPERNMAFLRHAGLLRRLVEEGCLLQVDAASITGLFGEKVKSFSRKLLLMDMVSFIASDAHNVCGYKEWYPKAYRSVSSWVGGERADRLFYSSARVILNSSKTKQYGPPVTLSGLSGINSI